MTRLLYISLAIANWVISIPIRASICYGCEEFINFLACSYKFKHATDNWSCVEVSKSGFTCNTGCDSGKIQFLKALDIGLNVIAPSTHMVDRGGSCRSSKYLVQKMLRFQYLHLQF